MKVILLHAPIRCSNFSQCNQCRCRISAINAHSTHVNSQTSDKPTRQKKILKKLAKTKHSKKKCQNVENDIEKSGKDSSIAVAAVISSIVGFNFVLCDSKVMTFVVMKWK
jgi:hypothetical protein